MTSQREIIVHAFSSDEAEEVAKAQIGANEIVQGVIQISQVKTRLFGLLGRKTSDYRVIVAIKPTEQEKPAPIPSSDALRELFDSPRKAPQPNPKFPIARSAADAWPDIVKEGMDNPAVGTQMAVKMESGNNLYFYIYCRNCYRFSDRVYNDPAYPGGGGYCDAWNGAVGVKQACLKWEPNIRK